MAIAANRRVAEFSTTGDLADNTDLKWIIIPAYREVEIHAFKAYIDNAGGSSTSVELCNSSNTVLAEVSTVSTGLVKDSTASRFPIKFTNNTSSDTYLKLRSNGTITSLTASFEVHMDEPGFVALA